MTNVSSWADIVEALNGETGDITLNLTQDINLYYETDYVYGVQPLTIPDERNLTIEGNGHQIINLTNAIGTVGGIFVTNSQVATTVELHDVDFVNLVLNNAALVYCQNASDEFTVSNCGFEGKRYGTSYLFDVPSADFTGCFFDIPWIGTGLNPQKYTSLVPNAEGSSGTTTYVTDYKAKYCWFREHYTNWTIKAWSYINVNKTDNSTLWSFYFIKLDGCYIDGDMTMTNDSHSGHTDNIPIVLTHYPNAKTFIPTKMSVFNVDVTCVGTKTTADYGSFFGLYINKLYNENHNLITDWTVGYDLSIAGNYPFPIIATVGQAADEDWLRGHGFAI